MVFIANGKVHRIDYMEHWNGYKQKIGKEMDETAVKYPFEAIYWFWCGIRKNKRLSQAFCRFLVLLMAFIVSWLP